MRLSVCATIRCIQVKHSSARKEQSVMKFSKVILMLSIGLSVLTNGNINGQNQKENGPVTIRATAEGTASAIPDTAELTCFLDTSGATTAEAFDKNQLEFDRISAQVRTRLGAKTEITSSDMSPADMFAAMQPHGARRIFSVRLHRLEAAYISNAMSLLGEMNIRPSLGYSSSQEEKARTEAL